MNIIFIDEMDSFIVKSISGKLEKMGFNCATIPWNEDEIKKNIEAQDVVLAYIDDDFDVRQNAIKLLRGMAGSDICKVFLAGHSDDIHEVMEKFDFKEVSGKFSRPIHADEAAKEIAAFAGGESMLERKHILAVDDSGTMLTTIQQWLGGDYRVSVSNSAMNALAFLNKNIPDLILLDYEMPGCSGPQLLEILRDDPRTKDIPVIFLTGKEDAGMAKQVLALKPSGYLLKTMHKEYIIDQVNLFFRGQSDK